MNSIHPLSVNLTDNSPEFGILPHPATTNNPADLDSEPKEHGGLQGGSANAYNTPGPHVPDQATAQGLEQPKSREEVSHRHRCHC